MSRLEVIEKVRDVLKSASSPSDELIALGKALVEIGEALKGLPDGEAANAFEAAAVSLGWRSR